MTLRFALTNLTSKRAAAAVASAMFFGAAGALRGACARLESYTRTIRNIEEKYPERAEKMRAAPTFKDLDKKAEAAANRAAAIHAIAENFGIMLRLEFEPPIPKALTEAEVTRLADLTRLDASLIKAERSKAMNRRYGEELEVADMAASLFWTAIPDEDVVLKHESISKAIDRTRMQILTWSSPDWAELACLAADELQSNEWCATMHDEEIVEDDEVIEERHRKSEIEALDRHARQQQTIAYLDAERNKAAKRKAVRIPKAAA
jgi:hypothetical protein